MAAGCRTSSRLSSRARSCAGERTRTVGRWRSSSPVEGRQLVANGGNIRWVHPRGRTQAPTASARSTEQAHCPGDPRSAEEGECAHAGSGVNR